MRVVVADDTMLLREGVALLLGEAGFDVVGQAADAEELVASVLTHTPDVAIVDLRMPPGYSAEGIEAAATIRQIAPQVGVLLLSQHVEAHHAVRLIEDFGHGDWEDQQEMTLMARYIALFRQAFA